MPSILIVDDELFFRKIISKVLAGHGYDIASVGSGPEALEVLAKERFDLMISDVMMMPMNGMELLQRSHESYPNMGVIMLTGHDEIEIAVDAMKKGAFDFLVKPFQMSDLFSTVQRSLKYYYAYPHSHPLERKVRLLEGLITESASMHTLCDMIRRVAPTDVAVLLNGEKGSDFELIARTLHYYSPRKPARFLKFDCAAHSPDSVGPELFGEGRKNSVSRHGMLEVAKGTTLFLDNIHAMPLEAQERLFNVMQTTKINEHGDIQFDVRLIVASNEDLEQLAEKGMFSRDLYYRLSALCIHIPPLRDRSEDIPFLINQSIHTIIPEEKAPTIGPEAGDILYHYPWPGNEKELEDTVRKILSLAKDGTITKDMIPQEIVMAVDMKKVMSGEAGSRERSKGQSFKAYLKSKHKKLFE